MSESPKHHTVISREDALGILHRLRLGESVPLELLNFRGVSLPGEDLSGLDLFGADFSEADLAGADLTGARLFKAHLVKTVLIGATLHNALFAEAGVFCAVVFSAEKSVRVVQVYFSKDGAGFRPLSSFDHVPGQFSHSLHGIRG